MNADNITENILDAINVIVEEKLKKLDYDKTYKAIVIGTDKRDKGRYNCETEGLKYEAIGAPNEQLIGDIVYVNVPQNNWSKQKNIIGRSVMDENKILAASPFTYFYRPNNTPFYSQEYDDFFITANENQQYTSLDFNETYNPTRESPQVYGDKCNYNSKYYVFNENKSLTPPGAFDEYAWEQYELLEFKSSIVGDILTDYRSNFYTEPFTALGIKIKFDTTNLGQNFKNMITGQYGLKINFLNEQNDIIGSYDINSTQMFGNIYNSKEIEREFLFNIDQTVFDSTNIINFELQQNGEFKYLDQNVVKEVAYNNEIIFPESGNIKITSISLYFGYDLKEFSGCELKLNTNDSNYYNKNWNDNLNTKKFFHNFLYRDEKGQIQNNNNLITSLWHCMGENDSRWEKLRTFKNNSQTEVIYTVTKDQCNSNTNIIRVKAQIEWQNKLIDSNIVTLYKYDDGADEG